MAVSGPAGSGPRIYHIADVRLGGAFPFLGVAGAAHRVQVRETFARAVEQGLELEPSLVLVTGNLFGTSFPSRELAEFAREQIGRFAAAGVPVLIAAGPLDALHDRHYAAGALADLERVNIFPPSPKAFVLPALDLTVVGVSWAAAPVAAEFLGGLRLHRTHRHLIGACALPWPLTPEGESAVRRQVGASGATYVALGGSPVGCDLSAGEVAARCPGAPELVDAVEGEGSPLLLTLDDAPEVSPRPVARRLFRQHTVEPAAFRTIEELADAIRALGDLHLAAEVRLRGAARLDQHVDATALRDRLAGEFLSLTVIDESCPGPEDLAAAAYPELSVAAKLVEVAGAEMRRAASEDGRRRIGAALRLGLALLEGQRPA